MPMREFDVSVLGLMGIGAEAHLGFKFPENHMPAVDMPMTPSAAKSGYSAEPQS